MFRLIKFTSYIHNVNCVIYTVQFHSKLQISGFNLLQVSPFLGSCLTRSNLLVVVGFGAYESQSDFCPIACNFLWSEGH